MAAKVFGQFDKSELYKMVRQEGLKGEDEDSAKKLVQSLSDFVEDLGFNHVTQVLKKDDLAALGKALKLDSTEKATNKSVIRKRLETKAKEDGLEEFFARKELTDDLLQLFADAAGVEEDSKKGAKNVVKAVAEVGLTVFFNRFDVSFLQELMKSAKLKFDTNNQNALASALATGTSAKKEKKSKKASTPKFSASKKPLEKGITYQDIFQHYYADELTKFCKENELKNSGPKKEVINRILAFLDGDDTTKVGASPKKRKRSSSATGKKTKKASSEKKSTKKEGDKETTKSPKKSKKEEKEDKEDAAEESSEKKKKSSNK